MSHTRLPDGRWLVDVSKQGFRKRKILPPNQTDVDAQIAEGRLLEEYQAWMAGRNGAAKISKFQDVLEWWKNQPLKNGKPRQVEASRYDAVLDKLGDSPLHELYGRGMAFVEYLKGRGLRPATINRHIAIMKAAVRSAYDRRVGKDWRRMIPENYLSGFPTLPENNIRHRILNPAERDKLYEALPEYLRPLFYFATYFPCRRSEVLAITVDDVRPNLFRKKVWIPEERSKTGRGRFIPIPEELVPWVISMLETSATHLFSREIRPEVWQPIEEIKSSLSGIFQAACDKAEITGYNWHKTRQQSAMELMYSGWDCMQVMHVGGWKTMSAFKRYVNVDDIMLDIKLGHTTPDLSWRTKHAPEPVRRAA